ncbi:ER membrane glycoprotein subunit of the GPI transamidase complex-like protein [Pseudogymnoascus australis]
MPMPLFLTRPLDSPHQSLLYLFIAYKSLLLLIALCSPGPGYDTSASLLTLPAQDGSSLTAFFELLSEKLTSWDAIYFTTVARRGYLYEQEWAFALGWTQLISFFSSDLGQTSLAYLPLESLVGITIAHASHGLSVFALYHLACSVFPGPSGPQLAFIAGCLHILSPAGIFLSAPCGESTAAFLTFVGVLFFAWGVPVGAVSSRKQDGFVVLAGVTLGFATTVRSNALLNGIVFAEEAVLVAWSVRKGLSVQKIRRLAAVGVGGCCIAVGFLLPQYIAYQEYCSSASPRPWCLGLVPSIYTFVQEHYWDVGFLRYWKVSNIPLFLLAAPALVILLCSGLRTVDLISRETTRPSHKVDHYKVTPAERALSQRTIRLLRSMAYPQLVLAVLAVTNYHVQIITRLASASPVWYLWLAHSLVDAGQADGKAKASGRWSGWENGVVMYMVMYGLIQAVLFASFLPPA